MSVCDPKPLKILQKFNVRKWLLKFTFYIDINVEKSWKCMIWSTKHSQYYSSRIADTQIWTSDQFVCPWNFNDLYLKIVPCVLFQVWQEQVIHMRPNTTKGTSCLLLRRKKKNCRRFNTVSNYAKFVQIEVILLKVQLLRSAYKLGRQDVPFVVMGHILQVALNN